MAKMKLANPLNDGATKIVVTFKAILPPEWKLLDGEELDALLDDEETDVEVEVKRVEELTENDCEDITEFFASAMDMDEFEDEIRERYMMKQKERYADRLLYS